MKKIFIFAMLSLFLSSNVFAEDPESLLVRLKNNRTSIYETLNLTQEQIIEIDKIDAKFYADIQPGLNDISLDINRIQTLAESDDCTLEKVKAVKKDFKLHEKRVSYIKKEYDKKFNKVLTNEQKSAYKTAKKVQKIKIKKEIENLKRSLENS